MKNAVDTLAPATRSNSEEASFLTKIQGGRLSVHDVLMAAPARLLTASVEEVQFPKRFASKVQETGAKSLADLLAYQFEAGKNLGARTLESAADTLAEYLKRKLNSVNAVTLRQQMEAFCQEIMAREARIFEMRFGLHGERHTLESVGQKFGLTRERVRQIEAAMFSLFSKRYNAVPFISAKAKDGMLLSQLAVQCEPVIEVTDPLPLSAVLECLDPKLYLVQAEGLDFLISSAPQTGFEDTMRKTLNLIQQIFRSSQVALTEKEVDSALRQKGVDEKARGLALTKLKSDGVWVENFMLSPDKDKANVAIGRLQVSDKPVALDTLVLEVQTITGEYTNVENLRSALELVPLVRTFSFGMVGFSRHVNISKAAAESVIEFCERVIVRGQEGYQWHVRDLHAKVMEKFPKVELTHQELNVILRDSDKLAYLGRMTFVEKGEGESRKLYRELFVNILKKHGKPMAEDMLVEKVRKVRGFVPNVHLRNEVEVLEVKENVWGLTRRDHPFRTTEIEQLSKAFDKTFGSEDWTDEYLAKKGLPTHGLKASEILKVIEVKSE
jgi:hypothetical protein